MDKHIVILDGAMGTQLQKAGMKPGTIPETLNITDPEMIQNIHARYAAAGADVIYANTFGANPKKLAKTEYSVEEVVIAAIENVRKGAPDAKAALDIGPLGELLEPLGSFTFEQAYEQFVPVVQAGVKAGADLIVIETQSDLYETKAAVLAAKEHSSLPVWVTFSLEDNGRPFTGQDFTAIVKTLEALGVDAIGLNCSTGPDQMVDSVKKAAELTSLPVIVKPNAGLPDPFDNSYSMDARTFGKEMQLLVDAGAAIIGGCCGTGPEYIEQIAHFKNETVLPRDIKPESFVCSAYESRWIDGVTPIGERINPTGKKRFQQALLENDLDYIAKVAIEQQSAGAKILDVNVGFPGVDEAEMLPKVVKKLQSVTDLPLQLDSSNPKALEAGLRVYNGKPSVNSVNGKPEVLEEILPVVKKYGASVLGLTLDKDGIPETSQKRVEIAKRILEAAKSCGIAKEDLWIDPLTLTVSAQQEQAKETLEAVDIISNDLGLHTVLGVSNISFGLPARPLMTQIFLTAAMSRGLTLPIVNVNQKEIMDAITAFRVLSGHDRQSKEYIERFASTENEVKPEKAAKKKEEHSLFDAIVKGLDFEAAEIARKELETRESLEVVENILIPALDEVGNKYADGKLYLPSLLSAAQAAQAVFEVIKQKMAQSSEKSISKGTIILATVAGDIHDIGKNIVKTVLENYGFTILDLGRDVPVETVKQAALENNVQLVGLSALMTTTLPSMEETVKALHTLENPPKIMVGGAVVTPEFAKSIGADFYAKDAQASAAFAREVFGHA